MRADTISRLDIRLLGTFGVLLDGTALAGFRSTKVRALLAYLAVESGRPHRRETLATLLWGEYPEHDALRSLSQALSNLRGLLARLSSGEHPATIDDPLLVITWQTVEWRHRPDLVWVDLHAFDALLAAAELRRNPVVDGPDPSERLAQAVELYRGPFLAELSLPNSAGFEEWRLLHQEQRHKAALEALNRLVGHYLTAERAERVEGYARRQLALEPWNEGAHQNLMLALALGGQQLAALRQYDVCRSVLAQELGVAPSAETEALQRQIRDGKITAIGSRLMPAQAGRSEPSSEPCAPSPDVFVARDRELTRLSRFLDLALAGQGRVAFVAGEAGSGKTALLGQFGRRAAESHPSLVVTCGRCSAYAGTGDPFLPFRELLQALCGEIEPGWSDAGSNADLACRLRMLFPQTAEAMVQAGADLVGRFVSGEGLAARAATLAPPGAVWRARLAALAQSHPGTPAVPGQEALFEQVTRVLQALAQQKPMLLLLDDLQWADAASLSLLFHLGRHLAGCRILLVGAYRPGELAPSGAPPGGESPSQRHGGGGWNPLQAIVHEFTGQWGDITVDLDEADGRRFVDAVLDCEPNRLGEAFRVRLARHTEGHALFTVALLRAFQERGELLRDEEGRWVEGPALPAQRLPPRVEAVIAERVGRLPRDWRHVLDAAAVEGESFSAEVVARALDVEAGWVCDLLSGPLSADSKLVHSLGVQRLFEGGKSLSRYRFAHVLFQEYLYGQLDAVERARLHETIGRALETIYVGGERPAGLAAILAWHYEMAGMSPQAAHADRTFGLR